MIKLNNVSKSYTSKHPVLKNINLQIRPGEFVSIVGQSGSGKTTLVKVLIGEEKINEGKVEIGGWEITKINKREVPFLRRQIGVIFQDFKLLPKKTLYENVTFALEVCGQSPKRIKTIVPQVFKIVGLEDKMNRYPDEISGGEKQRVAIARALVHSPKVLLADEPTGNLDAINANEIVDLLLHINRFGTTVVLVSHNKEIINRLNKRVIVLEKGAVVSDKERGKYIL